ncbi:hypothetical protein FPV67DRAFT_1469351 [Lyophyllum atratum]|nr:hypothetical protein FPV67DRAFT_1469351 [Lyophyllum atratum]
MTRYAGVVMVCGYVAWLSYGVRSWCGYVEGNAKVFSRQPGCPHSVTRLQGGYDDQKEVSSADRNKLYQGLRQSQVDS